MQCFSETGKGKERGVGGLNSNDSNCRARKQFPYHNPADNIASLWRVMMAVGASSRSSSSSFHTVYRPC